MKKIISVFFIIFLLVLNYFGATHILEYSISTINSYDIKVLLLKPFETLIILFTLTLYLTFLLILPVIFVHIYHKYKDCLYLREKYILYKGFKTYFLGLFFAIGGFVFTLHFTLPILSRYNVLVSLENSIGFQFLFTFLIQQSLLFFIISLVPLVIRTLKKLEVVKKEKLRSIRKHAFVSFLFISIMLTPPDIVTTLVITTPMYLMYELSII